MAMRHARHTSVGRKYLESIRTRIRSGLDLSYPTSSSCNTGCSNGQCLKVRRRVRRKRCEGESASDGRRQANPFSFPRDLNVDRRTFERQLDEEAHLRGTRRSCTQPRIQRSREASLPHRMGLSGGDDIIV